MKKIIYKKQPKNEYLIVDALIDLTQVIAHQTKSVYIKYLVKENGDLVTLNSITRGELKKIFKKHLNEYLFNDADELENAFTNGAFETRKKRLVAVGDLRYTYIRV